MVRHDPANHRGPPIVGKPKIVPVMPPVPSSLLTLRPVEEYERLWAAGMVDLTQAIRTIKAYLEIGLPGANIEELRELADRLTTLVEKDAHK